MGTILDAISFKTQAGMLSGPDHEALKIYRSLVYVTPAIVIVISGMDE